MRFYRRARRHSAGPGTCAVLLLATACTVGPDYVRPAAPVPTRYKEAHPISAQPPTGWKVSEPADMFYRGAWWSIYHDPVLDTLERRVVISNQNIKAAAAALRQSEEIVAEARAGFFPTANVNLQAQRSKAGGVTSASGASLAPGGRSIVSDLFSDQVTASWTPDLWGSIRRQVEANVANAQASAADLASALLSAQGTLAGDYLQLRIADELKRLLDRLSGDYAESLRITRNQYAAGVAAESDVAQAQALLASTQAQAIATGVTRAVFEHAIAVLIGVPPADFSIPPSEFMIEVPQVPPGLPSALLERRPDIAAAERLMVAVNAEIGVQVAAFYPSLILTGNGGTQAAVFGKLFNASSGFWSIAAGLAETVFEGGMRHAQVEAAIAVFDQDLASYRQTILTAFQQVEDQLAALRIYAEEAQVQDTAVAAAREAVRVFNNQYLAGTVAYTSVVLAEETLLADLETALTIRQNRLVASASLIQALGGGWNAADLPSTEQIKAAAPLNFSPLPPLVPVQGQGPIAPATPSRPAGTGALARPLD
jgi:NodT family efflux transporter outer membrane factor (OMF) lipoprotein